MVDSNSPSAPVGVYMLPVLSRAASRDVRAEHDVGEWFGSSGCGCCVDLVIGMAWMVDRMQGLADQMNGEAGLLQRGKQPRPLEDGNWVCDDPSCGNVNYPRRTEVSRMQPNWNS